MSEHSHFEELAALKAGGFLEGREEVEFREHTKTCLECRKAEEGFNNLRFALPVTLSPVSTFIDELRTRPDDDIRRRFLQRARLEGITLSPGVEAATRHRGRLAGLFVATALTAAIIVAVAFYGRDGRHASRESVQAQQEVDQLKRENSALTARLSRLEESVGAGQREIQNLRAQLGNAAATAENLRRNGIEARADAERSSSRTVQLLDEAHNQEKLLAEAKDEAARINGLRANDEASLVDQQLRIMELTDKLRIASATLDMERQLAAAGEDLRELIVARQLHVIDVRDTDPNGNQDKAFGRVFVAEGKSLTFYAFDLNGNAEVNPKRSFQVWAVPEDKKDSSKSLGFLRVDAKAQGRWVLQVENSQLLKEINSVFVTVEPAAGGKQPSGQKMLYAYLGTANHS
jgi:anti-sigma-K factor RskA